MIIIYPDIITFFNIPLFDKKIGKKVEEKKKKNSKIKQKKSKIKWKNYSISLAS